MLTRSAMIAVVLISFGGDCTSADSIDIVRHHCIVSKLLHFELFLSRARYDCGKGKLVRKC